MNKKLSIASTEEILRLRNLLQQISHISFSFSKLNQNYPLDSITEDESNQLRHVYHALINDAQKILEDYKEIYG